jgi:hypothetical protein
MGELTSRTRAQESRAAIERIYIAMRHLFIRGSYKPMGVSGEALKKSLITLSPEIYGSIADEEKVEVKGLLYVMERLPQGIEECRYIRMVSREGLDNSHFKAIIPPKRVRNCYRVDDEQMFIEMTRGRSDIYDILTHLTFIYNEAEKIRRNSLNLRGKTNQDWKKLEELVLGRGSKKIKNEQAYAYLSSLLGRTYDEVRAFGRKFSRTSTVNSLFHITYWLGKRAIEEYVNKNDREIIFSSTLRKRMGHHFYGELWSDNIKNALYKHHLIDRPLNIISANLHSVLNCVYAKAALKNEAKGKSLDEIALLLSKDETGKLQERVRKYAENHGMMQIEDNTGTNLAVQIIDADKIEYDKIPDEIHSDKDQIHENKPVLIVMDYAFGEQAYETMDELLKPVIIKGEEFPIYIDSISIMGKAGILEGNKGDIMIATSHVFEGTADNYPIENEFSAKEFEGYGLDIYEGSMVTVLGTSLQNRDVLRYFLKSSWSAVGLEMEGAHYQKAIQSASRIRSSINSNVKVRYAYYASDNPLETGSTLASGGLGSEGVKPTYLITRKILNKILQFKLS